MNKMKRNDRRRGQSIVEAMIALAVLSAGFSGILALLSQSLHYSKGTADELTATYLASEGIELAKNIIDHDVYAGGAWGTCLDTCRNDGSYEMDLQTDPSDPSDSPVLTSACSTRKLGYDPDTELYGYNNPYNTTTTYARCIAIQHFKGTGNNFDEVEVKSTVYWGDQDLTLQDNFFYWNPAT